MTIVVADVIRAPDRVCMANRRNARTAFPILIVVGELAAALRAADRTKDGPRGRVTPHAVGSAVLGVVKEGGGLSVCGKGADRRTRLTGFGSVCTVELTLLYGRMHVGQNIGL